MLLVENIRSYYDILVRNQPQESISPRVEPMIGMPGNGPGLKLKR